MVRLTDRLRERAEAWRTQNGEIDEVPADSSVAETPAATPDQPQSPAAATSGSDG